MLKPSRSAVSALVALLAAIPCSASADNPVLRIMPLGDSITHGSQSVRGNGYRAPLYVALTNLSYNVDYVGTETDNYGKTDPFLADSDHEGHSGWKLENASNGIYDHIQGFFAQIDDPHVILLHLGTNDTGDGEDAFRSQATNRLVRLLDRIYECQPSAKVVVTTLMRRYTTAGDTENNWKYAAITNVFNPAVPGIVAAQQAKGQDAFFLDMHGAVTSWGQIADTVHPNDVGYTNMANAWVSAVTSIVPDPTSFATENDLAVVQTTMANDADGAFTVDFTFNQKVTAATACDAANWTVAGTAVAPTITLSANQRTATLAFPAGVHDVPITITAKQGGVRNATGGKTLYAAASKTIAGVFPQGARHYVPADEFNNYRLIYDLDMPVKGNYAAQPVGYNVDDAAKVGAFSRVAYYMELQKAGEPMQYVWVSMDAFTNDATRVGVPVGWQFIKDVTNLRVWSNVANIRTNQTIAVGNIEFWPEGFNGTVKRGLEGALAVYDMDDTPSNGDYGSMQVHDTERGTNSCIFTFNRFQKNDTGEMGIGPHFNPTNSGWDWTQTYNAGQYSLRHLQVYVLPEATASAAPEVVSVSAASGVSGVMLEVKFSTDVLLDSLNGAFALSEGSVVSIERDGSDFSLVRVYATGVASGSFRITVDGVKANTAAATPMEASATMELDRPLPSGVAENVPANLREGYLPIYSLSDIDRRKTTVSWRNGAPYDLDATSGFAGGVERVAYYFETISLDGSVTNFAWTSFDSWTDDPTLLGVPVNDSLGFGQKWVTNQDVYSNVGGVVNGTGMDGGFLEFWPHNYSGGNANNIPYATGVSDWGDSLGSSGWYACMQVHNVTNKQTIFALNNFNGNNASGVCAGIGNNTQYPANDNAGGTINSDWTQAYAPTRTYSRIALHVFAKPKSDVPAHIAANVPAAKNYSLLYQIDVPTPFNVHNAAQYAAAHTIDNRARYAGAHVVRVGYYLELTTTNASPTTTWCWTAFDGFTDNLADYSFATNNNIKRFVTNLDVKSNVSGVSSGWYPDGNIEFFFSNYGRGNGLNIGASTGNFDFDDVPSSETASGYSCFQIHNYNVGATLISIGNMKKTGSANSDILDIGIGNCSTASNKDWTQTYKGKEYSVRRLYVFIALEDTPATLIHAVPSLDGTKVCALFRDNVQGSLRDQAAWTFTAGGATVASVAASPFDTRELIIVPTAPLAANTSYTLRCSYDDAGVAKTASVTFTTPAANPLPSFLTAEAVPEAANYTLVNLQKIKGSINYSWQGAPYNVDESRFVQMDFDRVAYLLHLVSNNGLDQWVWTSMDAFTDDIAKVGIPSKRRDNEFQQYISNLSVRAYRSDGNPYVTAGDFEDGNIEFCWHDYSAGNGKNILNASGSNYDWGDNFSVGKPGYGCLQVHNYRNSQVVLSASRTGSNSITGSRTASLGIGNRSVQESGNTDDDWTLSGNGGNFTTSDLYVLVRQKAPQPTADGPVFTIQPQSAQVSRKQPYTLRAFAPAAVRYQWYEDGRPIANATTITLTVTLVNLGEAHEYKAFAFGYDGSVSESETASLALRGMQLLFH
ncbi:MAG: hypothetical protein IKF72_11900 [Kiritimatiellae bacterium]|nr:hypothetical protein [Kiritimatiellia bacterium]